MLKKNKNSKTKHTDYACGIKKRNVVEWVSGGGGEISKHEVKHYEGYITQTTSQTVGLSKWCH